MLLNQEKFKLRSPSKATQEEIDLTKRYIGVNEQLKQSKVIKNSVITGRRYTSPMNLKGLKNPLPGMAHDLNIQNLSILEEQLVGQEKSQI